jgi:hypothetical protein
MFGGIGVAPVSPAPDQGAASSAPAFREEQQAKWKALTQHIEANFHRPDLEALECVLSAVRAHHAAPTTDPVWLFVIGPSGSGKTSIIINAIASLPKTWVESSLTARSFISGMVGGEKSSLLEIIGESGVIAFKDFTTMLNQRDDEQKAIIAQLREIADGEYKGRTGQRTGEWRGKITVIAATTPAIEKAWSIHRVMGERFLQVRWANSDSRKVAKAARKQRGREKKIAAEMKALALKFFQVNLPTPEVTEEVGDALDDASTAIAKLRHSVERDRQERIIGVTEHEEPTRIAKALENIACHHAGLFGKDRVDADDLRCAWRVAFDSIPRYRLAIMRALPVDGTGVLSEVVQKRLGDDVADSTYRRFLDELVALKIVKITEVVPVNSVEIHPDFVELWAHTVSHSDAAETVTGRSPRSETTPTN